VGVVGGEPTPEISNQQEPPKEPTMIPSKDAVVQREMAGQAFRDALGSSFHQEVFTELTEREPELAWLISSYQRTAIGSFACFRGSLSRKDCLALSNELLTMACLIYRCLKTGYRELLQQDVDSLCEEQESDA